MKKTFIALASASLLTAALGAHASKPTSITFESEGVTPDGVEYANYIVKCSNGQRMPLTAWDKRKKWCVGLESQEDCHKKQIKAAKEACKAG
ncbi:MAG TPA: hypothetical protein VL027_09700 [Spongiibacteraceae bacterium]|nr:hypothetical protein [Spongiibacteraceae bacterium]HUH38203.1 hypothetical protein [Spongiibacteraceae bacterium]